MLKPTTEAELADAIASATSPLAVRGGGTRGLQTDGTPLMTSGLSGITLYEPGALTIVAKAGTPVAEIEAALAAENQMLAFEPMDHRTLLGTNGEPTIGGVVAGNISGPRRVQAGACRDFLLGVRFVDGEGTVIKNGGRVMKNVTGYDLARLMCGAHGTLGVLSEVSLKVLPKQDVATSLLLTGLDLTMAVAAMSSALASPFEVSGAAHTPQGLDGAPVTMLRLEGFEASVSYRADKLKNHLAKFGDAQIETRQEGAESVASGWRWLRNVEVFADKPAVWRLAMKATDLPEMFENAIWQTMACDVLMDWGGGQVWVAADEAQLVANASWQGSGPNDPKNGAGELHRALQHYLSLVGGHATLVKGPDALRQKGPVFQPESPALAKLAAGLRQKFDPRGILNPGLMG